MALILGFIGFGLLIALGYLFWVGVAWLLLYLLGFVGIMIGGSVWAWGAILFIVVRVLKAIFNND